MNQSLYHLSQPMKESFIHPAIKLNGQSISNCTTQVIQSRSHTFKQPPSHIINQPVSQGTIHSPSCPVTAPLIQLRSHLHSHQVTYPISHYTISSHPVNEQPIHPVIQVSQSITAPFISSIQGIIHSPSHPVTCSIGQSLHHRSQAVT